MITDSLTSIVFANQKVKAQISCKFLYYQSILTLKLSKWHLYFFSLLLIILLSCFIVIDTPLQNITTMTTDQSYDHCIRKWAKIIGCHLIIGLLPWTHSIPLLNPILMGLRQVLFTMTFRILSGTILSFIVATNICQNCKQLQLFNVRCIDYITK